MATNLAPVRVDRITLTNQQIRAAEIMLYQMADSMNRLLADNGVVYGKIAVEGGQ